MSNYQAQQERFLEELQAHIVLAGGRLFLVPELRTMELGNLLQTIGPNGVVLAVSSIHFHKEPK